MKQAHSLIFVVLFIEREAGKRMKKKRRNICLLKIKILFVIGKT